MMFKSVAAVAFLAVASHALADEAATFKMSARELFGMGRRQTDTGYTPTDTFCGMGATCAEACGAGFEMCASNDNSIHCFNAQAKQICCPDGSGNSCDAGYFCAGTVANGATICCLNGQSLDECAKSHNVTGALTSQVPKPTTTTTISSSSSTSSSSILSNTTTSYSVAHNSTSAYSTGAYTTCTSTLEPVQTYPAANTTTKVAPTSTPTPTVVPVSAGALAGPAGALVAFAAVAFAALL
ncbi:uncharacterized protein E0L32_007267 [Thyridium curvatum]|uniref:Uncharacterized protein n=1 Tax=Thyridium curvatum TaxID=1093900 RepID=A0A507AZU0_9PEZI|nr:uncharacterized protein E0L32_007267 [Thyridium curvatum]TPX11964.1 hypothetical protein E0L32_007267 [Thyridium curvatum]